MAWQDDILTDLSASALADAVKWNLYEYFMLLRRSPRAEVASGAGLTRWRAGIPHPWFNGILAARPAAVGDSAAVEEALAYFDAHGVTTFTWWLAPGVARAAWEAQLAPHGFRFDSNTPGMAIDLDALDETGPAPPGLEIRAVSDGAGLETWVRTFIAGFALPDSWRGDMAALIADIGLDWPARNYLATLDGKPVATSSVILAGGVAGIQCVATLPAARGRGIGAAITLAPLLDARRLGYRVATLQSSEMGYRVYERLGFREVCKMEHFYWSNDDAG
jgi:GNAT superfamily N-acetyltransferase